MTAILVVEDDPSIRLGLEDTLTAKGYAVEVVGRGHDAVERANSGRYDLIVLDVMLPDLDGFAIARRLRDGNHRVPVIFLTAKDATEDKVAGGARAAHNVTKPGSLAFPYVREPSKRTDLPVPAFLGG